MRHRSSRRLDVAPFELRVLASAVDTTLTLVGAGTAIAAVVGARYHGRTGRSLDPSSIGLHFWSWRRQAALEACTSAVSLYCAINGSPGRRIARIEMVDSRSGEPLRLPQAIRYVAARQALRVIARVLGRALSSGARERARVARESTQRSLERLGPDLEEIRRAHSDDPEAAHGAMARLYEEHKVDPRASCLPQLVAALVEASVGPAIWASALRSPLRQGPAERLARVAFVRVR